MKAPSRPWLNILVDDAVQIGAEANGIDRWGTFHRRKERIPTHEMSTMGTQLPNGYAIPGDYKVVAPSETSHNLPTVVSEFALTDRPGHPMNVAQLLRDETRWVRRTPHVFSRHRTS